MCQREGEAKRGKRERRRREIGRMNRRNREVEKGKGKGKRKGREWKGGGGFNRQRGVWLSNKDLGRRHVHVSDSDKKSNIREPDE